VGQQLSADYRASNEYANRNIAPRCQTKGECLAHLAQEVKVYAE